jgi:hypothetical protein
MTETTKSAEFRRLAEDCKNRSLEAMLPDIKRQCENLAREYEELADRVSQRG